MICEKCGKEIHEVVINVFTREGSDVDVKIPIYFEDKETNAVCFETNANWCGYELTEDEQMEDISCPHCKQFPFNHKEVQVHDVVRVVCFADQPESE